MGDGTGPRTAALTRRVTDRRRPRAARPASTGAESSSRGTGRANPTARGHGKRHIGDSFGLALGLDLPASVPAARGEAKTAVAAYGAGEVYWGAVGHPQRGTPELGPVRERYEDTARSLLGDAYEEVRLRSVRCDPEAVVRTLLDGSGRDS